MAAFTARYRSARSWHLWAALVAICLAATTSTGVASAKEKRVAIGEVSTNVVRSGVDLPLLLRATIETELAGVDFSHVSRKDATILSVSLVRMDTESTAQGASTTCVVSATLRTKKGGTVFAILEGRSRTENSASGQTRAEANAIKGAVRGAITRLPDALR